MSIESAPFFGAADDPTGRISLDFDAYVAERERKQAAHMADGVPDYAFSLDWTIRRRLDKIVPLRKLAEILAAGVVPFQRSLFEIQGVAVGPSQFPELHSVGVDCAERLGIGVPQLFVLHDPSPNAFTFCTSQVDQIVVVTSGLLEALGPHEVRAVIGHECGHIHNRHVIYNTVWELLTNTVGQLVLQKALAMLGPASWFLSLVKAAFSAGAWYTFGRWHRCAEITCDRAALICSTDVDAAVRMYGKIHMGAVGGLEGFDPEAYKKQTRTYSKSWARLYELFLSHPPGPKRTAAAEWFIGTDAFASWRPDARVAEPEPISAVDARLEKLLI